MVRYLIIAAERILKIG